jgi:hypothetical protein
MAPTTDVEVVVPPPGYLAVDGRGDPNTSLQYAAAVEALFTVAYTLKLAGRKALGEDLAVGPLEGLWRAEVSASFVVGDKDAWD